MSISEHTCYERIIWKANKRKLFQKNCIEFADLEEEKKMYIKKYIPNNSTPVLVFWGSYKEWTILCIDILISYYDKKSYHINLSIAKRDFAPCIDREYVPQKIFSFEDLQKLIVQNGKPLDKTIEQGKMPYKLKTISKWLYSKNTKEYIWMPGNFEVYALWGVLIMINNLDKCKSEKE